MATEAETVGKAGIEAATEAATAAAGKGEDVATGVAFADEDAELERLVALQKAEAEAGAGNTAVAAAKAGEGAAATSAATTAAAPANVQQPAAKPAAPEALTRVLIKERSARRALETALAVERGRNQVLTAISRDKLDLTTEQLEAAGIPAPKDERTTEERITDIDTQLVQLAQDYDDARISASEWKKRETELQNQKFALQTETLRQAPAPQEPVADLGLEEHAAALAEQYPVIKDLTVEQLNPLKDLAYSQAQREGKPIQDGTAVGTKDLRERMAKLATQFYGGATAAPAATTTSTAAGSTVGQQQLSETAQQRADKLALAAAHPANIAATGSGAPAGTITDDAALQTLNAMGGDEEAQIRWLMANPKFASKVTGGTAGRP